MPDTAQIAFLRARRLLLLTAAEAAGLPGLTPVEREQMRAIAELAGLQLHRVNGVPNEGDERAARTDARAITQPIIKLFRAIFEAAAMNPYEDDDDAIEA